MILKSQFNLVFELEPLEIKGFPVFVYFGLNAVHTWRTWKQWRQRHDPEVMIQTVAC